MTTYQIPIILCQTELAKSLDNLIIALEAPVNIVERVPERLLKIVVLILLVSVKFFGMSIVVVVQFSPCHCGVLALIFQAVFDIVI